MSRHSIAPGRNFKEYRQTNPVPRKVIEGSAATGAVDLDAMMGDDDDNVPLFGAAPADAAGGGAAAPAEAAAPAAAPALAGAAVGSDLIASSRMNKILTLLRACLP